MAPPRKRQAIDLDDDDDEVVEISSRSLKVSHPRPRQCLTQGTNEVMASLAAPVAPTAPTASTAPTAATNQSFIVTVGTIAPLKVHFPERILAAISEQRRIEIQINMQGYELGELALPKYTYKIKMDNIIGAALDYQTEEIGRATPCLSYANILLLKVFGLRNVRLFENGKRPVFVSQPANPGVKNPRFAHLHATRYGEVGIAFDEDNCLSIAVLDLVHSERVNKVLYVERQVVEAQVEVQEAVEEAVRGVANIKGENKA